jgi:hypothetical protein
MVRWFGRPEIPLLDRSQERFRHNALYHRSISSLGQGIQRGLNGASLFSGDLDHQPWTVWSALVELDNWLRHHTSSWIWALALGANPVKV